MRNNILTVSAVNTLLPTIILSNAEIFKGESPVTRFRKIDQYETCRKLSNVLRNLWIIFYINIVTIFWQAWKCLLIFPAVKYCGTSSRFTCVQSNKRMKAAISPYKSISNISPPLFLSSEGEKVIINIPNKQTLNDLKKIACQLLKVKDLKVKYMDDRSELNSPLRIQHVRFIFTYIHLAYQKPFTNKRPPVSILTTHLLNNVVNLRVMSFDLCYCTSDV